MSWIVASVQAGLLCVSVGVVGTSLSAWILFSSSSASSSSSSSLPPTHPLYSQSHTTAASVQSLPPLLSIAFTCVTLCVLPWRSPQCSTHTVSPSLRARSRLVADDAGRLRTSSLPLGRRPIFTTGHKVYRAAQHIYGTASNHSSARKTLPSTHPLFASLGVCASL